MKKLIILYCCLTVICFGFIAGLSFGQSVNEKEDVLFGEKTLDVNDRLEKKLSNAYKNSDAGLYKDAVEDYLFVLDNRDYLKYNATVRTTIILTKLIDIGEKYPYALQAIKYRRKITEEFIIKGNFDREDVIWLLKLNRYLKDEDKTIGLYLKVKKLFGNQSKQQSYFASVIWDDIVRRKQYDDLSAFVERRAKVTAKLISLYEAISEFPFGGIDEDPIYRKKIKREITTDGPLAYEALIALKRDAVANKLKKWLLRFNNDENTYRSMIGSAMNAGRSDLVEQLKIEAKSKFPGFEDDI